MIQETAKIIEKEFEDIKAVFNLEKESFQKRKQEMENMSFASIIWSSAYIDFCPYESVINQMKPVIIYKEEKRASIKNCYWEEELVFACHNENENWGTVFIDNGGNIKKWLLFLENDDDEMVLQQLKMAYLENDKYVKVVWYLNDKDVEEETMTIDLFEYHSENQVTKINRLGFFENAKNILPVREMNFLYNGNKVQIYEKDKSGIDQVIYNGKIL